MELHLQKTKHPNYKIHEIRFNNLIGLDVQKSELLLTLQMILNKDKLENWEKKHHKGTLPFIAKGVNISPLIILSGEVGCGKTELAQTVGTPLAKLLQNTLWVLQTPSDIRGAGLVGQLSARVTNAFIQAKNEIKSDYGILLIDEADDLASDRAELQSHREDKAGVNALIKEIDAIEHDKSKLAVILITNRMSSLDPAVVRRACLHLEFKRPGEIDLHGIFKSILEGTNSDEKEIDKLLKFALNQTIPYSYSDLFQKVAKLALMKAVSEDIPFNSNTLYDVLSKTKPTPLIIND